MKEFIENLAEQFDDVELEELKEDTLFQELEDWSVKDLYQLITSK